MMRTRHGAVLAALALAACQAPVHAADDTLGARLAAIEAAQAAARDRYSQELRQAETPEQEAEALARRWEEIRSAARRAFELAEAHPDDPEAIDAIIWTVQGLVNGHYPEYADENDRAYTMLTERALASEKVAPVCVNAGVTLACPAARHFLEEALESSPSRLVRAAACLGLARDDHIAARLARRADDPITRDVMMKGPRAGVPGFLERLEAVDPVAATRRAEAAFERVIAEFGDLELPTRRDGTLFGEQARKELFALRHLSVGRIVPDFEGEDVRGGNLKLSDHRGKVAAIVFWATWCGPCMDRVPHERELVRRLEGRPFVLIGVNGDEDRSAAAKAMAAQSMTWPSLWDGGKPDGLAATWGVRSWPTIYILDAEGVIRYEALSGDALDQAIDRLVEEAEAARK